MSKQIDEVMGLVNEVQKNRVCAEMSPSNKEHFNYLADKAFVAISDKLRELLPVWQPIETAPKTREAILVWCPARKNEDIVSWDDRDSGDWSMFGAGNYLTEEPSHWMPLPKAPE